MIDFQSMGFLFTLWKRLDRSPLGILRSTILFDRIWYREVHPDLRGSAIDSEAHYLEHGVIEGRNPHPLFDTKYYLQMNPDVRAAKQNPLIHYILHGARERRDPHPAFNTQWYLEQLSTFERRTLNPLEHYLTKGKKNGLTISPTDDGRSYLSDLGPGDGFSSRSGAQEMRLRGKALSNPSSIVHDLRLGAIPEVPDQLEWHRRYQSVKRECELRWQEKVQSFHERDVRLVRFDDHADPIGLIAFPTPLRPKVSIIVPCFNEYERTVEALLSISRTVTGSSFEVILADDCSTDGRYRNFARIANLKIIRGEENKGFLSNVNDAMPFAVGNFILLLNNDAQLLPDAFEKMQNVLEINQDVGAVGPKILFPNGRLQEAGCSISADGHCTMIGVHESPDEPKYNYDRDVHYISGACLMVRREAVGKTLFDLRYRPAYFEDVDLCMKLRTDGWRIRYCAAAHVVHILTASGEHSGLKQRRVSLNQQAFLKKWSSELAKDAAVRVIAFYLPQFHRTQINDRLWGAGFTEWHNVTKADPCFPGHLQPHLPTDLGFYDLSVPETLDAQGKMARRYGIAGFCMYYYNFGSKRALDKPLSILTAHPEIDFPFCLCWANENWTRHWDGGEKEIAVEQLYSEATYDSILIDFVSLARDDRYLRVNGKPLILIYRPLLVPEISNLCSRIRNSFAAAGFPGVHLLYVESMEAVHSKASPEEYGFDGCVEFPPHGIGVLKEEEIVEPVKPNWAGIRYDYPKTAVNAISRTSSAFPRYGGAFPSWDNTARQPNSGTVFEGATPEAFQAYVESKLDEVHAFHLGDERLLFINAWNEWAEGAHLEPDRRFGHRFLEAIRNALWVKRAL